jgi:hypothetical protein
LEDVAGRYRVSTWSVIMSRKRQCTTGPQNVMRYPPLSVSSPTELQRNLRGLFHMLRVGTQDYILNPKSLVLLDEALRVAFTRLYDAEVLDLDHLDKMRDVLIASMVPFIMLGETDVWRLARRGI